MIDHAHELRRHARKIGHPAGDTPAVMRAAAAHIDDLERRLREADDRVLMAVKAERDAIIQQIPGGSIVDPQWVCDMIRNRGTNQPPKIEIEP